MLRITVMLFASYREIVGAGRVTLYLDEGTTVRDLAQGMRSRFPGLPEPSRIVVAVNNEYQEHGFALSDGDEVALIPPVSGG